MAPVVFFLGRLLLAVATASTLVTAAPAPAPQGTGAAIPPPPPLPVTTSRTRPTTPPNPSACGLIHAATSSLLRASPSAAPVVPASLAYECLRTVPNKPGPAGQLIDSLRAYIQWQSTLTWLKNPPDSYKLPPTDVDGNLEKIKAQAIAGQFESEYDFGLAIVETISAAHDGHFSYRPDVFKAFQFRNSLADDLVSISADGRELPKLFHYSALFPQPGGQNRSKSAIASINGDNPREVVERLSLRYSLFQDMNSQWNAQFPTYATPGAINFLAATISFERPSLILTYENGEERSQNSLAFFRPGANFSGIRNGEDYYNRFCNPLATAVSIQMQTVPFETPNKGPSVLSVPPQQAIAGYPAPVVRDNGANTTSGYFLNGAGYDDVAVLSLSAFAPPEGADELGYLSNFQSTVADFLAESKAAGKKRLVVDVIGNGGGFVVAGYDLFAQIFPDLPFFQAHNLRRPASLVDMALLAEELQPRVNALDLRGITSIDQLTPEQQSLLTLLGNPITSNLIPGTVFTPGGRAFTTAQDVLAPISLNGDTFTAFQNTPLNETSRDFNLTGTGNRSRPPPAVFKPEDIVILTDGTCGSTCTLFAYLMTTQANVRTTVVGGRPVAGPMQSIAGVEGAQVFPLNLLAATAQAVLSLAPQTRREQLRGSELETISQGYALLRAAVPARPGAINAKNAFAPNDAKTPLQFLMSPANCRFFYTKEMVRGPEEVWKRTVDATWTNPQSFCSEGSITPLDNRVLVPDVLFRQTQGDQKGGAGHSDAMQSWRLALGISAMAAILLMV